MEYIILDLEFNGTYSKTKHRFFNEIIEFGAVKCDEQLNIISAFSRLIDPQVTKKLNSHVSAMTHIKLEELRKSHNSFSKVLSEFKRFLGDGVLMSWSNSDLLVLMENQLYFHGSDRLDFVKHYANLQTYCERALGYTDKSRQMGLSACAEQLGLSFEDSSLHRAYNDAELTAKCFKKLYDPELLKQYIKDCDSRFYGRLTFKNYNICDINDASVNRKEMYFDCEICGRRALRCSKWKLKNKSFRANFRCLRCRRDFEGRIVFKRCYDHVEVIKKTAPIQTKEQKKTAKAMKEATKKPKEKPSKQN